MKPTNTMMTIIMRKYFVLLSLFSLMLAACNSGASYPSNPETVLRKGFEALNEKSLKDVNRYFALEEWQDVLKYKEGMDDGQQLSFRIEKVLKTEFKSSHGNEDDMCGITAKVIRQDGFEENLEFALIKSPSGRWKIFTWSRE